LAQNPYSRGLQRGETQFTTQPQRNGPNQGTPITGCIGCLLPVLLYALLVFMWDLHHPGSTSSTTSRTATDTSYINLFSPTPPPAPQIYYAKFQIHDDSKTNEASTALIIKNEIIRIITVPDITDVPVEKKVAAERGVAVDGVRPAVLKGTVIVTVAALEEQDEWSSLLLVQDGDLRQALLEMKLSGHIPRPPPGGRFLLPTRLTEGANSSVEEDSLVRDFEDTLARKIKGPLVREVYIVGRVMAIHTPALFHKSRSTTNIIDLDLRVPASQRHGYEMALTKYVEDKYRYEHRYDTHYERMPGGRMEDPASRWDLESRPIERPVEARPFVVP
jgi:hypothetical protein